MPQAIHVSAPGKLMLLGEHAVVHARPCLVTAMDSRLHMTMTRDDAGDKLIIRAPDVGVEHVEGQVTNAFRHGQTLARGTRFIESSLQVFREHAGLAGSLSIETRSDFSSRLGLGSSSATVACTLYGLAQVTAVSLSQRQLFELGLEAIRRVQRTGSGFDLAAAIWGGTLFYDNANPRVIAPIDVPDLPLVAAYSGIKADTATYVQRVTQRLQAHTSAMTHIFDATRDLVLEGRDALRQRAWPQFGELMDIQHGLAHALGVDIPQTAKMVFAARDAGAFGAKLSGAGGGDCIIALTPPQERARIEEALEATGGEIIRVAPHAPGVRIESER